MIIKLSKCLFAPIFTYFYLFAPTLFIFIFERNIYRHQHFHFLAFLLGGLDLEGTSIGINLCQSLGIRISILLSLPVNTTLSFPSGPGNWVSRWFSKQPKRWPLISLWLNWASETFCRNAKQTAIAIACTPQFSAFCFWFAEIKVSGTRWKFWTFGQALSWGI